MPTATLGAIVANATTMGGWLVRYTSSEVRYLPPSPTFSGIDTFRIDNNNNQNVITVTVNVLASSDPPTAGDVSATVDYGSSNNAVTLALGGGVATSVAVARQAANGTATAAGTNISYTPRAGYAGPDSFTYTATNAAGTSSAATMTIAVSPPAITVGPPTLPAPVYGTAYSQTITASGGTAPYSFAVTFGALPTGLTLATDGTLSGTPTVVGTLNFTVTATDQSTGPAAPFTGSRAYSFTIAAPVLTLSPAAGALPGATTGSAYSQTISANGALAPITYQVTAGALPSGVTLNPSTGILSGTPTVAGTFNFTVTATDASSFTVSRAYSLTVSAPTLAIDGSLPPGKVAVAYRETLTASEGVAPYSFTLHLGTLPAGLTLSAGGVLSGTPTQSGLFNLTIRATDSGTGPAIVDRSFALEVAAPTVTVRPPTLRPMTLGVPVSTTITASGGTAPYRYGISAGALPAGLTLANDGALFGTPTTAGDFSFTVTATDSSTGIGAPYQGRLTYNVTVGAPRVTFVVESADDGAFAFTSAAPSLNFVVNAAGGSGTSGPLNVPPGSHRISFTVPENYELASVGCSDPDSSLDAASRSGTLSIQAGDDVVCTIVAGDVRRTTELIGGFLEARSGLIIASQPDRGRRLERLTGNYSSSGGIGGFGFSMPAQGLPLSIRFGENEASFGYSMRRSRSDAPPAPVTGQELQTPADAGPLPFADIKPEGSDEALPLAAMGIAPEADGNTDPLARRFDIWAEGKLARFNSPVGDGRFGILHAGADYLVSSRLLVGLGVQVDWTDMEGDEGATIDGTGYLVGPYVTARLSDTLFLDARASWGQSSNTASPLGTYEDKVDGTRWLISGALIGQYDIDRWRISPSARLTYFEEETDSYVDGLGFPIPQIEIATGTFEFGPRISYGMDLDNGMSFEPFAMLEGIWTFEQKNTGVSATSSPGLADEGLRGRAEFGFALTGGVAGSVSASAFYDGLGNSDDFEAWGGRLRFNKAF